MRLNNPLFRPPAEADSLILQVDVGCPYNRCSFCGMYCGVRHARRSAEDVLRIVQVEARRRSDATRVFLADGDVMRRPFDELAWMLRELGAALPRLARVNTYATARGIAAKTAEELEALRDAKLHTLYLGLESGDDEVLRRVEKAEDSAAMVEAGRAAQAAGLHMSVMVLLGLGGVERTVEHAERSAAALNRMQPRLLSLLRVVPVPGTPLFDAVKSGAFRQVSEFGVVEEMRRMVSGLELERTLLRANHSSNVYPLEARLPRDKSRVLAELDALLASGRLDRVGPGPLPLWL